MPLVDLTTAELEAILKAGIATGMAAPLIEKLTKHLPATDASFGTNPERDTTAGEIDRSTGDRWHDKR
jgi:hypothetical protein